MSARRFSLTDEGLSWRVRKASPEDESFVFSVYEEARAFLKKEGVDQWQDGYPGKREFRQDLASGQSYILEVKVEDAWRPAFSFYLSFSGDADYDKPAYKSLWSAPGAYAVLHRTAVSEDFRGLGLTALVFYFAACECRKRDVGMIRADTHKDNRAMQHALEARGFGRRGDIILGGTNGRTALERIAYDIHVEDLLEK